ncbi:MAG TPA: glycoside hydrolase family 28 protein [Terriglobales bacterium]|nr:glycoside hydrolase family 28 protein [Terriglobales bacterium]
MSESLITWRRNFLKGAGVGAAALAAGVVPAGAVSQSSTGATPTAGIFDVRTFGAKGDGKTIDSPAINKAIEAAAQAGGGTVAFPAGNYASYSIHLKSFVSLYLCSGATILAASIPLEGTSTEGYDAAEAQGEWEPYQDFGHNHWHNSLIWGENIHDISISGPGLIWGKGLSRGLSHDKDLPNTNKPGAGNKAIALKNCRNVILRDFSILQGGWFAILATGVDNFTIDNLKIDTNRDGMDIDCCKNVHVSNCTVNSPWDDGICPKSSFALGYARATENLTITNCYVTGKYQLGTLLDGTFKEFGPEFKNHNTGRIKFGTESNGGFKNITVSNCVFEGCRGLAIEAVDGAICEDITIVGITMRELKNSPMFLRLGARMRGPKDASVGRMKRILISDITSYNALPNLCSIISGIPGHNIEDLKIRDIYLHQLGGGTREEAALQPEEKETAYPEPTMFGTLPASGFFVRHCKNLEFSNVEIAAEQADHRPAFWLKDVDGADFFRVKGPVAAVAPVFALQEVRDFRVSASRGVKDTMLDKTRHAELPSSS